MKLETIVVKAGKFAGELICYEYTEWKEMPVEARPAIMVIPGGSYAHCSDREGEPVALEFFNRGYNAYVLRYPCAPVRYPAQLVVAAAAMDTIRKRATLCKTDVNKVFAVGFSVGGHLCGCLANCPENFAFTTSYNFRPNGVVLSYALIGGMPTHLASFQNLLGGLPEGETAWLNLHTSVRDNNPPAFIWATANDSVVPAINSLRYANAYAEKGIHYALHIYPDGPHGISLADERTWSVNPEFRNADVADWVNSADEFLRSL